MTREELREKVARAILLSSGWAADEIDDPISGPSLIESALPAADAALAAVREALREPSDGMIHQGAASHDHPSVYMGGPSMNGRNKADRMWRAMLAASPLAEPGA